MTCIETMPKENSIPSVGIQLATAGGGSYDKWPLLLTWFNFNPSMDK